MSDTATLSRHTEGTNKRVATSMGLYHLAIYSTPTQIYEILPDHCSCILCAHLEEWDTLALVEHQVLIHK